jgi:hypothetical protein
MGTFDFILHLLNFFAPALGVAVLLDRCEPASDHPFEPFGCLLAPVRLQLCSGVHCAGGGVGVVRARWQDARVCRPDLGNRQQRMWQAGGWRK